MNWSRQLLPALLLLGGAFVSPRAAPAAASPSDTGKTPGSGQWGLPLSAPRASFETELLHLFDSSGIGGKLGLTVWSKQNRQWLHTIRPDTPFVPASTLKLITTAAALDLFDPDWRPQTIVRLYGSHTGKVFRGKVTVSGRGDPSLSGRFFGDPITPLRQWGDSLRAIGIDTLIGGIEVDRFWYPDAPYPSTWASRFRDQWYGAEITALAFNDNCALLRILPGSAPGDSVIVSLQPDIAHFRVDHSRANTAAGNRRNIRYSLDREQNRITVTGTIGAEAFPLETAIPVRHSQYWFESAFREALLQAGIELIPEPVSASLPLHGELRFSTAPLSSIVTEINTRSQNFYAENLLRLIGAEHGDAPSIAEGHRAIRSFLRKSGIDTSAMTLLDGSGLSLGNRIEPRALNLLLQKMISHPRKEVWWNSMAWPGSGTRMPQFSYPSRTRFKTGFVNGVQGLAGYIATALGDTLSVVIYINGYTGPDQTARRVIDSIWTRIADHEDGERRQLHLARLLHRQLTDSVSYPSRLLGAMTLMEKTPYVVSPTGEGSSGKISDAPLIRIDGVDCVTFMEHAMALAESNTPDAILPLLTQIRYRDGIVDFSRRNHFFVDDWIASNTRTGRVRLLILPGDTAMQRTMGRRHFADLHSLDTSGIIDPVSELRLLPREKAIAYFDTLTTRSEKVYGAAIIGSVEWLWSTHVGFIHLRPGLPPHFRHASTLRKEVTSQPIADYLREQKKITGIILFEVQPGSKRPVSSPKK